MSSLAPTSIRLTKTGWMATHAATDSQVADLCLRTCGGGYTEEQTAEAMEMLRKIGLGEVGDTFPVFCGYYFVIESAPASS
jgi:hypothetical protein